MQPTESLIAASRSRSPLRIATVATAITLAFAPAQAPAFFQSTSLEGGIGHDISGVWLAMHHVLPEFRIRFEKPQDTEIPSEYVPFKVGPVPADLSKALGPGAAGVAVTEITDSALANRYGIYPGDVIRKIGSYSVRDVDSWQEGLENAPKVILLTVRRPSLKQSKGRLFKLTYEASSATEQVGDGSETVVAEETFKVEVLDVALPGDAVAEEQRKKSEFWEPSAADIEALRAEWFKLSMVKPLRFLRGDTRVVASSHYGADLAGDSNTKDTLFAMVLKLEANPVGAGGGQLVDIYGIREINGAEIAGTYVTALIARAPFPISVEFKGNFTMTRLDDLSDRDVAWRKENSKNAADREAEDLDKFELAPDIPTDLQ
ncbi:MAG: hypothetical protein ACI8TX_003304 [Hyphomicrobiaceae bacterium]|jgi:hypothetical protein